MSIFKSVGHIALKVTDLDVSVDFYNRIGFPEILRLRNDKGGVWIVYHRVSDDLYLELFPSGEGGKVPGPERTGLFHLCLTVENADVAEKKLKDAGVTLGKPRKPGKSLDGNRGMWIEDLDGYRIEIMEMAPDCIQYMAERNHLAGSKPHVLSLWPRTPSDNNTERILPMKGVLQLAHVALKVKDLDASLDFYVNKLGFQEMMRLSKPDGSPGIWLVYLRITDDQYLELFPDGVGQRAPGRETTGMNHLCLGVADIDGIIAELKAAGIPLTVQKKMAADLNLQCWIDDPDGNRIEIMQIMPDCLQLEAIARLQQKTAA